MLQSVDWGAVAFGIVLVELDGKNATKDTGVRHLLAAQGHVYQLVKMPPVPCQHSDPMLCTYPQRLTIAALSATQPRHLWDHRSRQGALKVLPGHHQHRCTMGAQARSAAPRSGATPASEPTSQQGRRPQPSDCVHHHSE